jgi:hypothetical protein
MVGKLLKFITVCVLIFVAFRIGQVFALADPDVIRLESITRYDDVAVTGDMFILVEYTLEYVVLPNENISQGWLGRLLDVGGAGQLASVQPFAGAAIPDLGYSRGTYGFYFATEPTITGTLRVTLEGNPTLSPTPAGLTSDSITQRAAADLAPDLRAQAIRFEDIWNVDLVSPISGGVNRYTQINGEEYFSSALPNLRNLAPDMFVLQTRTLEVPDRSFDTTYTAGRFAIWNGTPIQTAFQNFATFLGTSETVARFVIALFFAVLIAAIVGLSEAVRETDFTIAIQIWVGYLVMFCGFWLGMVTVQVLGLMLVIPVVIMAVQWNLNRTNA